MMWNSPYMPIHHYFVKKEKLYRKKEEKQEEEAMNSLHIFLSWK